MWYTSEILISESRVRNNIEFIKDKCGEGTIFSSVVKGHAYGHGIDTFVPIAQRCGVDHFSVFSVDEAYKTFKEIKPGTTIMIMGMIDDEAMDWVIEHDVEFYVFEMDRLERAQLVAEKMDKKAKVHVEVETGMNRTGFSMNRMDEVYDFLKSNQDHIEFKERELVDLRKYVHDYVMSYASEDFFIIGLHSSSLYSTVNNTESSSFLVNNSQ